MRQDDYDDVFGSHSVIDRCGRARTICSNGSYAASFRDAFIEKAMNGFCAFDKLAPPQLDRSGCGAAPAPADAIGPNGQLKLTANQAHHFRAN